MASTRDPGERAERAGQRSGEQLDRTSPELIPLAETVFSCTVCGSRFAPRGGELTCTRCTDSVIQRDAVILVRGHGEHTLAEESPLSAANVLVHAIVIATFASIAGVVVVLHWWAGTFDDWAVVIAWGSNAIAGVVLASPFLTPPPRDARAAAWVAVLPPVGAVVAAGGFALLAALQRSLGLFALLDILVILGVVTFLIGASLRLSNASGWCGYEPSEAGLIGQAGPTLLGVFITSAAYMLTLFFLRSIDFADACAAGIAGWLTWRALDLAWHAAEVGGSRISADARTHRAQQRFDNVHAKSRSSR